LFFIQISLGYFELKTIAADFIDENYLEIGKLKNNRKIWQSFCMNRLIE